MSCVNPNEPQNYLCQDEVYYFELHNCNYYSFGASHCVIIAIISSDNKHLIIGHISASMDLNIITRLLFKHKNTFQNYKNCSLYFTNGQRDRINIKLRNKLSIIFKFFKIEPIVLETTKLLIDSKGNVKTEFSYSLSEKDNSKIQEKYEELRELADIHFKQVEAHVERVKGIPGLDEYGRPPRPGLNYRFCYVKGKWVHYDYSP